MRPPPSSGYLPCLKCALAWRMLANMSFMIIWDYSKILRRNSRTSVYLFHVYEKFAYKHVWLCTVCVCYRGQGGHRRAWHWSFCWYWANIWLLGAEPKSSVRTSAPKYQAIHKRPLPQYTPSSSVASLREAMNKWDPLKLRSFCKAKDMVNKRKQQPPPLQQTEGWSPKCI